MKRIINRILLFLLFVFIIGASSITFADDLSLTVVYSSNTLGELEAGCCPEAGNNGGLARRAFYIKGLKEEVKNLLVLDGGDALAIGLPGNRTEREKARRRAELVLKIYEKMGYGGLNIGDTDLVLGVEYLKGLQKKLKIPFISANLKSRKSGRPVFRPFLIKEINGFKIGIMGLLTPEVLPPIAKTMGDYFIDDPVKVASDLVKGPLALCDTIIVLAHLDPLEIETLARSIPKSSIIVGGNNRAMEYPREIGQSLHVQTDAYGFHMGRLNLTLVKGSSGFKDILPANLTRKYLEEIGKKLEISRDPEEIKNLHETRETLLDEKRKLPDLKGENTYEHFFIPLHPGMEADPEIENLISSSRDDLKRPLP